MKVLVLRPGRIDTQATGFVLQTGWNCHSKLPSCIDIRQLLPYIKRKRDKTSSRLFITWTYGYLAAPMLSARQYGLHHHPFHASLALNRLKWSTSKNMSSFEQAVILMHRGLAAICQDEVSNTHALLEQREIQKITWQKTGATYTWPGGALSKSAVGM